MKMELICRVTLAFVVLHFIKRELETIFVHRFSVDTMPVLYIFRNSFHYYVFAGAVFGYVVYHPFYVRIHRTTTEAILAIVLYLYAELSNLNTHLTLRRLRPEGTRVRGIPHGYGFDWPFGGIDFPNYFFEIMAWVVIGVWSGCWAALPFIVVALYMMDRWSQAVQFYLRMSLKVETTQIPKRIHQLSTKGCYDSIYQVVERQSIHHTTAIIAADRTRYLAS